MPFGGLEGLFSFLETPLPPSFALVLGNNTKEDNYENHFSARDKATGHHRQAMLRLDSREFFHQTGRSVACQDKLPSCRHGFLYLHALSVARRCRGQPLLRRERSASYQGRGAQPRERYAALRCQDWRTPCADGHGLDNDHAHGGRGRRFGKGATQGGRPHLWFRRFGQYSAGHDALCAGRRTRAAL